MKYASFLGLVLPVFFGGLLPAQTPAPAAPSVNVQFSLCAWRTPTPELFFGERQKVEKLEPFDRAQVQAYAGPATLSFFTKTPKPSPDKAPPAPNATVTFPPGATKFTLITTPAGGGNYQMFVVPEDDAGVAPPAIRLYNFSASRVLVVYDERSRVEIAPAASVVLKPQGAATVIHVAGWLDGKWRRLFNNVIELNPSGRQNVVLAPDENRPVSMFTLPAWPLEPAPAPAPASAGNRP